MTYRKGWWNVDYVYVRIDDNVLEERVFDVQITACKERSAYDSSDRDANEHAEIIDKEAARESLPFEIFVCFPLPDSLHSCIRSWNRDAVESPRRCSKMDLPSRLGAAASSKVKAPMEDMLTSKNRNNFSETCADGLPNESETLRHIGIDRDITQR